MSEDGFCSIPTEVLRFDMTKLPDTLNVLGHTFEYTTTFQHAREYKNLDTDSCIPEIEVYEPDTSMVTVTVCNRIFGLDVPVLSKLSKYDVLHTITSEINENAQELLRYKDNDDPDLGLTEYRKRLKTSINRDIAALLAFNKEFM